MVPAYKNYSFKGSEYFACKFCEKKMKNTKSWCKCHKSHIKELDVFNQGKIEYECETCQQKKQIIPELE